MLAGCGDDATGPHFDTFAAATYENDEPSQDVELLESAEEGLADAPSLGHRGALQQKIGWKTRGGLDARHLNTEEMGGESLSPERLLELDRALDRLAGALQFRAENHRASGELSEAEKSYRRALAMLERR